MNDLIPLGTGNSRFLKSSIPENITFAQLVQLLRGGTFPVDFNGLNPEGISQMGSAYSKGNVLPDDVCAMLGISTESEPKDAFSLLQRLVYTTPVVLQEGNIPDAGNVTTINIDVDTAQWEDYDYVLFDYVGKNSQKGYLTGVRLNNSNSNDQTYWALYSDYRDPFNGQTYVAFNNYSNIGLLRFNVRKNLSNYVAVAFESDWVYSWGTHRGKLRYSNLNSLTFVNTHSSQTWQNFKYKIYGVNIL